MARRLGALTLLAALLVVAVAAIALQPVVPPTADALARDIAVLTAPGMDGRAPGTSGGVLAGRTIAAWLEAAGLEPGGDDGTFFQSFVLSRGIALAPGNQLEIAPATELVLERDWRPHGGSTDGEVAGPLVFVGHGIERRGWNDYDGVGVRGKIVVVLDGAPEALRGQVVTRAEKISAARRHGAAAALLVTQPLPSLEATDAALPLVSASVSRNAADRLLGSVGLTLSELEAAITERGRPAPRELSLQARLRVGLAREDRRATNVIGILPGADPALRHEAVVVGAHFDHVGVIDGEIHHGADDNASGTAIVVNLARAFAAGPPPRRTLVFALFDAEELGLIGSRHYVRQPPVPIEHTVAMINLDMVGRLREHLSVGGVGTGRGLRELVADAARDVGVRVRLQPGPWAPSDHLRFFRAGVPVVFFTTGIHEDYHRPTDLPERLSVPGMARVAGVVTRVVQSLAEGPPPVFVDVPPPRDDGATGSVLLGVVADHHAREGVRLAEVMPGTAAELAGLREGDVILSLDGHGMNTFVALRRAIAARAPGTVVEIVYLRDGEVRVAHATLGRRTSGSGG